MLKYKTTYHHPSEEIKAPEGFYFKASHFTPGADATAPSVVIIWEGRPTPPSLVKLCNEIVRASYIDALFAQSKPTIPALITNIERELDAHGLREPT